MSSWTIIERLSLCVTHHWQRSQACACEEPSEKALQPSPMSNSILSRFITLTPVAAPRLAAILLSHVAMLPVVLALAGCARTLAANVSTRTAKLTPADLSTIRGANYRGSAATNTSDYWLHYSTAETERDLTYADRLKLNQLRVFVNYASWQADKTAFRKNLVDLARVCNRHHIGLMITVGDSASFINNDGSINREHIRDFVSALVDAIGREPALAFWDASNEPEYNSAGSPPDRQQKRFEIARLIAATLHELDKTKTPVTIGVADERNMETLADAMDVLSFHDYLATRAAISNDLVRAKAFAAKTGKQVMNTEIGCIARANPYDVTLEEHLRAVGPGIGRAQTSPIPCSVRSACALALHK